VPASGRLKAPVTTVPGLARYLSGHGEAVLEVGRAPRSERRLRGKNDELDAVRAPRAVLAHEPLALPRSGERREALRLLLIARRGAVDVRREALAQLRSVIVTAPDRLRDELRGLSLGRLLDRCSRLRRLEHLAACPLSGGVLGNRRSPTKPDHPRTPRPARRPWCAGSGNIPELNVILDVVVASGERRRLGRRRLTRFRMSPEG
jgi:hypothetical protein